MKVLYLLLLITLCQGLLNESPSNVKVSSFYERQKGSWLEIQWSKVENRDEADPILGYKVKVWELKLDNQYKIKEDGTMESVLWEDIPPAAHDIKYTYGLQLNGTLVPGTNDINMDNLWLGKFKVVYKERQDGTLEPPSAENLVLNLRTDPNRNATEITVPAHETKAVYKVNEPKRLYDVAVQAYTATNKGPLSKIVKIVVPSVIK